MTQKIARARHALSRRKLLKLAGASAVAAAVGNRPGHTAAAQGVTISGELKTWHRITFTFDGPGTSETATPNPFLNFRLDVVFRQGERAYRVPGYFAADGDAAETGADRGNQWRVHFAPDAPGEWTYEVSLRTGDAVAVSDDPDAGARMSLLDGLTGTFEVAPTDKTGRDLRGKGRLDYVGEHYLRFAGTGEYFLKGGADAPENFLAYEDFDNTPNNQGLRKTWEPHLTDWREGDPTWRDGKGKGIIGALNYLASKEMNAVSFLTMNINGDDRNVFPYINDTSLERFDCSKLDQWEIVLEHATQQGLFLHFKTQETENDQLLDGGEVGVQRRLYYRELIARFGHHLALNWNVGEENSQTDEQRRDMALYFWEHDPYHHPVVIHTFPGETDVYSRLIGDQSYYTGASLQAGAERVHRETLRWVEASAGTGKKWVVANDEQGPPLTGVMPDADDYAHDAIRRDVLWGNLMAGGAGVEYYFGYDYVHSDLTCQDYRSRDHMWELTDHALAFFRQNVPYWAMVPRDNLATHGWAFVQEGAVYVVYVPDANTTGTLDVPPGTYTLRWYNPRAGVFEGATQDLLASGGGVALGAVPADPGQDWVALIVHQSAG